MPLNCRQAQFAGAKKAPPENRLSRQLDAFSAEAGRFPEAIETGRRALELARQQDRGGLVEALNARIKLYEVQKPYRDELTDLSYQQK